MQELTQEAIDKLKAQHPEELHLIEVGPAERQIAVVVKVPNRERWGRFKAHASDVHRKATAMESLVLDCAVFPAKPDLALLFEGRPALVETLWGKIAELAGLEEIATARKL
jgi:hypothetical protein